MSSDSHSPPIVSIATLVAWLVCLAVVVLGGMLSYPARASADAAEYPPTQIVDAELAPQPAPPPVPTPLPPSDQGPPSPELPAPAPTPPAPPQQPTFTAVAPPSPAISFALPTEGLMRVVDPTQADHTRSLLPAPGSSGTGRGSASTPPLPPPKPAANAPSVAHLTFGQGEGRQPPPEYPRDAILARQEGTVGLRFTVDEDGRVQSVDIIAPSRWPLLNQAASRAVRDTWRFTPGQRRIYEVPIEFQLEH